MQRIYERRVKDGAMKRIEYVAPSSFAVGAPPAEVRLNVAEDHSLSFISALCVVACIGGTTLHTHPPSSPHTAPRLSHCSADPRLLAR